MASVWHWGGIWGGWAWKELCALCQEHVPSTHPWEVMGQRSHWARAGCQQQTVGVPCPPVACHSPAGSRGSLETSCEVSGQGQLSHGIPQHKAGPWLSGRCCSLVAPPDVRGLWIYRLDSRYRVNYRLQCLVWLDTEPAPATWNRQLPPCPCSRPQAELDPRYHWSRGAKDSPPGPAAGWGDGLLLLWGWL